MHLTPKELVDRLTTLSAAELARRRRSRGRLLNVPEAIALISDEALEMRRGRCEPGRGDRPLPRSGPLAERTCWRASGQGVYHLEVDALFPSGTAVWSPFDDPDRHRLAGGGPPGRPVPSAPPKALVDPCNSLAGKVRSWRSPTPARRPCSCPSHYHFFECNSGTGCLTARRALGMRAWTSPVGHRGQLGRPGERRRVRLVSLAGAGGGVRVPRARPGNLYRPGTSPRPELDPWLTTRATATRPRETGYASADTGPGGRGRQRDDASYKRR